MVHTRVVVNTLVRRRELGLFPGPPVTNRADIGRLGRPSWSAVTSRGPPWRDRYLEPMGGDAFFVYYYYYYHHYYYYYYYLFIYLFIFKQKETTTGKDFVPARLRVVPHFSSGIVERAKRERA